MEATPSVSPLTGTSDNISCSDNERGQTVSCCVQGDQDMIKKAGIDGDRDGSVDLQMMRPSYLESSIIR